MELKLCAITAQELVGAPVPTNYIVHKLIDMGAPIKVLRSSLFDVSEYKEYELEISGTISVKVTHTERIYKW